MLYLQKTFFFKSELRKRKNKCNKLKKLNTHLSCLQNLNQDARVRRKSATGCTAIVEELRHSHG